MIPLSPPGANWSSSREPATADRSGTRHPAPPGCGWLRSASSRRTAPNAASTNRAAALRKLRLALAYRVRQRPAEPPERVECAVDHADYPLMLAHLLDLLEEEKWELKPAAERCGISATALVKRLARDPELWSFANRERLRFGHCPLRKP